MRRQNVMAELMVRCLGAVTRRIGVREKTLFIACFPKSRFTF
jgi:hypothetical protein